MNAKELTDWLQLMALVVGGAFIVIRGVAYVARLHSRYEETERRVSGHTETLDEHKQRLGWIEGHLGKEE